MPPSGITELRIYLKELSSNNELLDDFKIRLDYVSPPVFPGLGRTRYYQKSIKVYSISEVLLVFFAIMSAIGAIFEALNFLFK